MSIVIYTYHDPYKIDQEPYWDEIKNCPYFCSAQTLVNGLRSHYKEKFDGGRVSTVKILTDSLYVDWASTAWIVKQHTDIDNIINSGFSTDLSESEQINIGRAFLFNRDDVFTSIRTMFELNVDPSAILKNKLTKEQRFILGIYQKILASEMKKDFYLARSLAEEEIDEGLRRAMTAKQEDYDFSDVNLDTIVIHGVHQFNPIMLRAIDELQNCASVFGYLQDMFVIPNADTFLQDIISKAEFEKNKRYSIAGFLEKLRPHSDIIIDSSNGTKKFSFGVSNGLRTLQDAGVIRMEYILDQEDTWNLYHVDALSSNEKGIMYGGQQEHGIRPGTIPVALVAGCGYACEIASLDYERNKEKMDALKKLVLTIFDESGINYHFNGDQRHCVNSAVNICIPGVASEALMIMTKQYCSISNGSACTSKSYSPSYVLKAMGIPEEEIECSVRISWGPDTSSKELKENLVKMIEIAKQIKG